MNFTGSDTLITIFNNAQVQNFNITVRGKPTSISFDPENWILKTINSVATGVGDKIELNSFSLEQNYPNPFNPTTNIKFSLPVASKVTLKVYDLIGNEITASVNEDKPAGNFEVAFDASLVNGGLSSGVYLYKLQAGDYISTKKLILLK